MKKTGVFYLFFFTLCWSCSHPNFIGYKSNNFIRQEFPERFFIDSVTNTGFYKTYGFRYMDKSALRALKKTNFYRWLNSHKDHLIPAYAATKYNEERQREYILVFKVKKDFPITEDRLAGFHKINLLRGINKKRSIQTWYAQDTANKWIASAALVRPNTSDTSFLVLGYIPYLDYSMIATPINADQNLNKNGILHYRATAGYRFNRYGSDTILQTRSFWNTTGIIQSIKNADQFIYHDYFKVAANSFFKNGSISYFEPVNILKNWDKNELELSDDIYSYSNYKQSLSTYQSLLGLHKEATRDSSVKKISCPEGFSIARADQYILDRIKNRKIIMFNELGFDVRNRAFLFHLLDSLKKRGFTHLAIEDLHQPFGASRAGVGSGLYIREPLLHNLIEYANNIGIQVIGYNFCGECLPGEQNKAAAKKLLNRVQLKKHHKLIILCGTGVIEKSKKGAFPKTLADYLQYYTGYKPFTVGQVLERWFYLKDSTINHYYVLRSDSNYSNYSPTNSSTDVSVFPPTDKPWFDYDFYYQNRLLPLEKSVFHYAAIDSVAKKEVTLYLYKGQKRNRPTRQLPLFVKQLKNKSQEVNIYSAIRGKSRIEIRDDANRLLLNTHFN
ncbi:hypothetical protein [Niabella hirudinis]|uniref:hypothetical protein n=1 Tax=Niabella hirudinis TaxID=1285929 RepID=UPI003EBFB3FB